MRRPLPEAGMIWRIVIALFLLFMLGPILLVVLFSFGSSALIGFPMGSLTSPGTGNSWATPASSTRSGPASWWRWRLQSCRPSPETLAAMGLMRLTPRPGARVLAALSLPVLLPPLVVAIAIVVLFVRGLGVGLGLPVVISGMCWWRNPSSFSFVMARLARFDTASLDAARDLGATRWQAFRLVMLPQIASALVVRPSSAPRSRLMTSSSPPSPSAAQHRVDFVWGKMRTTLDPSINAIATILLVMTIGFRRWRCASAATGHDRHAQRQGSTAGWPDGWPRGMPRPHPLRWLDTNAVEGSPDATLDLYQQLQPRTAPPDARGHRRRR